MRNKIYIIIPFVVLLIVGIAFVKHSNTQRIKAKVSDKKALGMAINLKKNKRENSKEYKYLQSNNTNDLIKHLKALETKEIVESYKNLLMSKKLISKLDSQPKKEFFNYITKVNLEKIKKANLYRQRLVPYFFDSELSDNELKPFEEFFTQKNNDVEYQSVMLDEMRDWPKLPIFAFDFVLNNLKDDKDTRLRQIALIYFSSMNNQEQVKQVYEVLKTIISKYPKNDKILFYTTLLKKFSFLKLELSQFEVVLSSKGYEWDQLKLDVIKKYSLEKKHKKLIRSIASGNSNIWVKQYAKKILEKNK